MCSGPEGSRRDCRRLNPLPLPRPPPFSPCPLPMTYPFPAAEGLDSAGSYLPRLAKLAAASPSPMSSAPTSAGGGGGGGAAAPRAGPPFFFFGPRERERGLDPDGAGPSGGGAEPSPDAAAGGAGRLEGRPAAPDGFCRAALASSRDALALAASLARTRERSAATLGASGSAARQ